MRIGIVGTGAIGTEVAKAATHRERVETIVAYDVRSEAVEALQGLVADVVVADSLEALVDQVDLVVETATMEAARTIVPTALKAGKDVLMMSIGAFVDDEFHAEVRRLATEHGARIWLPSGAVAGIDGVRAGAIGGLKSATLVTTKPPAGLGVEVDQWTVLFSGSAREAIARYPKNVNVAVCLSLVGLGADETNVQVVADPLATHNQHKIIAEGAFGRIRVEVENLPHPDNPKTSFLASLSAIATLQRILDPIQIGN